MKHIKFTFLLAIFFLMVGAKTYAYDACIGGIYYEFNSGDLTASVVQSDNRSYSGNVVIPAEVTYNNEVYSVTSIGDFAFSYCLNLTSITIPEGVTSIGSWAFYCCRLTSITLPEGVTSIDDSAFYGCTGLTSITLPESVTSIGSYAFYDCIGLTSITLPEGLTSIGEYAFSGCSGLTSITLPESVTSIGSSAFYATRWYNDQPDGVVYAGKVAYKYKGSMPDKTAIILKEGTKGIGESAFYGCTGLTSITIPEGVTSICDDAFSYCSSLTSITIPASVTSISYDVFSGCSSLESVHVQCPNPNSLSIKYATFPNRENQTLYVPMRTKAAYEKATYWKDFKEIIEEGGYIAPNAVAACPGGLGSSFSLDLRNGEPIVGFQFDLQLPEGVSLVTDSKGNYVASLSKRKEDHGLSVSKISDNTYRFVAVSMNNKAFTGTEGALLDIKLKVADSVALGDYEVKVMNTELTAADMHLINSVNKFSILTVKDAEPGDVNGDMKVSVTDVVSIIDDILNNTPSIFIRKAADVNGDNKVSVTDAIIVIDMILNEGKQANVKRNMEPQ